MFLTRDNAEIGAQSGAAIPAPRGSDGWFALQALLRERSPLAALQVLHRRLGDVFHLSLGGFQPVVMAGPEACHFVLVSARKDLLWRPDQDPVTRLLRRGLLVTDGQEHRDLRRQLYPPLHKARLEAYIGEMWRSTDEIVQEWPDSGGVDMLTEMRRLSLLILMRALFGLDAYAQLDELIPPIHKLLKFISPGPWLLWPEMPRLGYENAIREIDDFLLNQIEARRSAGAGGDDMLSGMVFASGLSDALIRDQLLTIMIAGHDTSTAHLSWTLWLLSQHPEVLEQVVVEVAQLGGGEPTAAKLTQMSKLEAVIKESLRLYPPIHLGNRVAARDLDFKGMRIAAGQRVVYSIYLTQRHPRYWSNPDQFDPRRFTSGSTRDLPAYTYLPFGGGPRNCIGMAFAKLEAKVVLSRLLQRIRLGPTLRPVRPWMGATLEPGPSVPIEIVKRRRSE